MNRFKDIVVVSALLMSMGLLWLVPVNLGLVASRWGEPFLNPVSNYYVYNYERMLGASGLSLVAIGLVVLWTDFQKGTRSTWLVMFIITWGYYFPAYFLPIFEGVRAGGLTWAQLFQNPIVEGRVNALTATVLGFAIMVTGLAIPVGRVFLGRPRRQD